MVSARYWGWAMVGVSYCVYTYNIGDAQSMALIAPVRAWRRALPASDVEGKGGETPCRQGEFERPGFEIACPQAKRPVGASSDARRHSPQAACREANRRSVPGIACREARRGFAIGSACPGAHGRSCLVHQLWCGSIGKDKDLFLWYLSSASLTRGSPNSGARSTSGAP